MNTYQLIESIQQVFPSVSKNQIRLDLDTAQKLIATETGVSTTRGLLSSISSNFAWNLPTGFTELTDLCFYDSNGNPKYLGDYNYKYEIEFGKLFIYSLTSTPITGLDSGISSAYIHYRQIPTTISTESTSMEVTEQFRDAIESYVLGKYFAKFPVDTIAGNQVVKILNLQAAQLHKSEYEKIKIKLKKYVNSQIKTSGEGQFYQHAGAQALPKRSDDGGGSSIVQISGWSENYTKFAYYKILSGDSEGVVTATLSTGYTTIACSRSGLTITVTSTAEFDPETIIIPSNFDAGWTRDSSSQYTITLPSDWATNGGFAFEIYERD